MRKTMRYAIVAPVVILCILTGCAAPQVRSTSPYDTPEHHYLAGMNALENRQYSTAGEKFDRAVYLNEKFSPAYGGLAIVSAEKVGRQQDAGFRKVECERLAAFLEKAEKYADTAEDEFDRSVATIRASTLVKGDDWLNEAEDAFKAGRNVKVDEQSLRYYQGSEAITYYMGLAYLEGREFQKARDLFSDVLNARREGKWHGKADRAWKKTDRIIRAMAGVLGGAVGKEIAVKDAVSRADLAALLAGELQLDKLFGGKIPATSKVAKMNADFTPADIVNHPFREEVLSMMKWKVRGMEPKFDEASRAHLFKPADSVSRGEIAFILEDLLIKLTGDEKIAVAHFGQDKSPFPDVRNTSPFYNAVMNMTTRGIMEGELSGEFRPNDPVSGADALLAIRTLHQMKTY